jgi:hypothetical protein
LEHIRTSSDERSADAATGARPRTGSENSYDPAPPDIAPEAGQPPAAYEQPRPEPVSVETAVEEEIMSKLPRKRPQRRATRRTAAQSGARKGTTRKSTAKKTSAKRTSTARASSRSAKAKNTPSLPEQAIGATISMARLPFRIGAGIVRRAGDVIGRNR